MATIKQDKYILGQSQSKQIADIGEEIRLDLKLNPQPQNDTGKVIGTITDDTGKEIPNSLIKIMDAEYNPLLHAISGTDGTYTFDNVPVGTGYNIFCTSTGKMLNQGTTFTIAKSQVVTRDFTLQTDSAMQLGIIAGDLFNSVTHLPVNGAVISLYKVNADTTEVLQAITYTNQYGQFVFRELAIGNYIVRITALGYLSTSTTAIINTAGQIIPAVVQITEDPNTSRGTVSGIITDNNNAAIDRADVVLYKVNTDNSLTPYAFTKTNSAGVYLFINVPQGNYKVKANQMEDVIVP